MAEKEFDSVYNELQPLLKEVEDKRTALKSKGTKNGGIAAIIIFIIGVCVTSAAGWGWQGIAGTFLLSAITWFAWIHTETKELSAYYKEKVIARIISTLCKDASFQAGSGIDQNTFVTCGLFPQTPDRYHSEDLISGKTDKTTFICSEVHAEERRVTTNSKGHRRETWHDIFRGFLFIADFQKDFKGQTAVFRNSWFKFSFSGQRVKLENPAFEDRFDVYSTDQIEARYILTPSLMERILALDRKFPGKITTSFCHSNVFIAIPDNTNHFEASIWRQIHKQKLEQEFGTIQALLDIINDLNLNIRIWTKE